MATIILQGTKEENAKAVNVLKDVFAVNKKKAEFATCTGNTLVLEVFSEASTDKVSDENVMRSLVCCSNAERNCSACAYAKFQNCIEQLNLDAASVIQKRFVENK